MMWRYYELLTDWSIAEIAELRAGNQPMSAKQTLARRIVTDFHSAEAAEEAQNAFDREVREGQQPDDIETVSARPEWRSSLPKIVLGTGLAESRTDAERRIKSGAVIIDGVKVTNLSYTIEKPVVMQVGKKWKRVQPES